MQEEDRQHCSKRYWTSARFGQEVIDSLNTATSQAKTACGAEKVVLVGFSGGGGAAALLSAKRQDVVFLGTVAGNLDTETWANLQGVSPLAESLNPIAVSICLSGIQAARWTRLYHQKSARRFASQQGSSKVVWSFLGHAWRTVAGILEL